MIIGNIMRSLPKAEARRMARTGRAGSLTIHRNTHGTPAEERVLFREVHVRQLFVAADIHGTDDNGLRATGLSHRFISRKLFFFSWQRVTVHEQEFGTIQAYAFGAVALSTFDIANGTNVGADFNLMAVEGNRRQIFQFRQFGFSSAT